MKFKLLSMSGIKIIKLKPVRLNDVVAEMLLPEDCAEDMSKCRKMNGQILSQVPKGVKSPSYP